MNAGRRGGFGCSGVSEPFLISHKMSVLLNVIILTCTEASRDAGGSCQHRALCSKSNKKSTTNNTQPRAIKIFIAKCDLTITVISKTWTTWQLLPPTPNPFVSLQAPTHKHMSMVDGPCTAASPGKEQAEMPPELFHHETIQKWGCPQILALPTLTKCGIWS